MNQTLRSPLVPRVVAAFCLFLLCFSQIQNTHAESWPTQWSLESIENESSEWVQSLRVQMVPGVIYHLQASESLAADSWTTLDTTYGSGGEWICPLFPGSPPPVPSADPPVIPNLTQTHMRLVWLIIEKTTNGQTLASWYSLDGHTTIRMVLPGVTLDPVWEDFDAGYMNPHGNHYFALSPRLATPVNHTAAAPTLGTLDTAMIAEFTSRLAEITDSISNSLAMRAMYAGQPQQSGDRKFYRIAADWSVDSDNDGRYDWQEIIFDGNNPFAADTDGDGTTDVAQDNSGPEPTLGTGGGAGTEETPPVATIQRNRVWAYRIANFRPNWPGWVPTITVSASGGVSADFLQDKSNFADFTEAVATLPLNNNNWVQWLVEYDSSNIKVGPSIGNTDPRMEGHYSDSFYVDRCAYRLKLDKPAPAGGYSIPLTMMRYVIGVQNDSMPLFDGPFSDISKEELVLTVEEGKTIGNAVWAAHPIIGQDCKINMYPLAIGMNNYNLEVETPFLLKDFTDGACVLPEDAIEAFMDGYDNATDTITIKWQKRRLSGDGSLGDWENITPLMNKVERESDEPPDDLNSRNSAYFRIGSPGIYQFQAEFNFPDGTKITVPYVRMKHAKGRFNSKDPRIPNENLEAGKFDYIGVCPNELSYRLRNKAVNWIGDTGYSQKKQVSIKPGWIYNPDTKGRNKCNLFVTHLANQAGAATPYYYRYGLNNKIGLVPAAPAARKDWHLNPEINIDLDGPGWSFEGTTPKPTPGMSAASFGNISDPDASGHVGIIDYDGSWINAGKLDVNKCIHLSDQNQHYKPTHFRTR